MTTKPIKLCVIIFMAALSLHAQPANTLTGTLGFIENKGQIQDPNGDAAAYVQYLLPVSNGLTIQLKNNGFSYDTYLRTTDEQGAPWYQYHRIDVELLGASPTAQLIPAAPAPDVLHYYTHQAAVQVKHFQKVTYKNIYPSIDLEFKVHAAADKPVEYNFILHPGACVSDIRLRYTGAMAATLLNGQLQLRVAHGHLTEHIPLSYWAENGQVEEIRYQIIQPFAERQGVGSILVGFSEPVQYLAQTLIIDPIPRLDWGTYLGGTDDDGARDMTLDAAGNVYIIGSTNSPNAMATAGTHQQAVGGSFDVFISKFNNDGARLWSTYYGGSGNDFGQHIATDAQGNVYVTGATDSPNGMATPGAAQETPNGQGDAFAAKFTTDGAQLWGTYAGGSDFDFGNGIAVDAQGNAFIIGWTSSSDAISTPGAHQTILGGGDDMFLIKYNTNGQRQWGTYIGGNSQEIGLQVKTTATGRVVVAGSTATETGMTTPGAHQTVYGGGFSDAYLAQFTTDGVREWSTYIGGSEGEFGDALAIDALGNIYIGGPCTSTNGLATPGGHQPLAGGGSDAFLIKFNNAGERQWGTYYGGINDEAAYGLTTDIENNVYLTGFTRSDNNIATPEAHQTNFAGGEWDAFLVKFTADGQRLWGSYYGGPERDQSYAIAVDADQQVFIAGITGSATGISTPGAHQSTFGGAPADAFVARFAPCTDPVLNIPNGGFICENAPFVLELELSGGGPYTLIYTIDGIEQAPITTTDSPFFFSLEANEWQDSVVFTEVRTSECTGEITGIPFVRKVRAISHAEPVVNCDINDGTYTVSVTLSGGEGNYVLVEPTTGFINDSIYTSAPIAIDIDYLIMLTSGLSCDTITISGSPNCTSDCSGLPNIIINSNSPLCADEALNLSATAVTGLTYAWTGPDGFSADVPDPVRNEAVPGVYTLIVADANDCRDTLSLTVEVNPLPIVTASADNAAACSGASITLMATGGQSYVWIGPNGFGSDAQNPVLNNVSATNSGVYIVAATDANGCANTASVTLAITPLPDVVAQGNSPVCEGDAISLMASGGATYSWTGPNGFSSNQPNPVLTNVNKAAGGDYLVVISDGAGCSTTLALEIAVIESPLVNISGPGPLCAGGSATITATGGSTYLWNTGATTSAITISPETTTTYSVVAAIGACQDSASFSVVVTPRPVLQLSAPVTIRRGQSTELQATGADTYTWTPAEGLSCTDCPNPIATPESTTNYCVTGTIGTCEATACVTVRVDNRCPIYAPNVFSPNGDGINDEWCVLSECLQSATLRIFDRWGNVVFSTTGSTPCWDGNINGTAAPIGVYVYSLDGQLDGDNPVNESGDFVLIR
ncbi:MAG TPA: SBBP repeat-containing protein [Saprospiraceae bacterium]|nr:SBBP repeat-containing protein [Saprospiraceae bacterium]HMP24153.1 SBBP repeat-containing protein [Saprospiraceae bacterium]